MLMSKLRISSDRMWLTTVLKYFALFSVDRLVILETVVGRILVSNPSDPTLKFLKKFPNCPVGYNSLWIVWVYNTQKEYT